MFIVETTWQGKRAAHSWLTCVSAVRQRAESYCLAHAEANASHRIFEIQSSSFPVFFISVPGGYQHLSLTELRAHLASARAGEPEEMLFNVYRFSEEYMWSTPGHDQTALHMHVLTESLAAFHRGEGELAEVLAHAAGA